MAKAKKKKPKKRPAQSVRKSIPISREQWLEHILKVSRQSIGPIGNGIDEFFQQQACRIEKELEELRKSK